jgi:hypothetical protein
MIPVSALQDFYGRDDAGYSTHYWFEESAALEIRAQGNSVGLARFPVYTRFLIIDIDRENDLFTALADTYSISNQLSERGLKHSVWFSGGKGAHIYIHCEEMFGVDVPYSQLTWVRQQGWKVDETLYQHARLLSNPGRKSKKTGIRKHKMFDRGGSLLVVPRVSPPERKEEALGITTADLARIALFRLQKAFETSPSSRHQTIWSLSSAFAEAGAPQRLTEELMQWVNSVWSHPKELDGLRRAVLQAYTQAGKK